MAEADTVGDRVLDSDPLGERDVVGLCVDDVDEVDDAVSEGDIETDEDEDADSQLDSDPEAEVESEALAERDSRILETVEFAEAFGLTESEGEPDGDRLTLPVAEPVELTEIDFDTLDDREGEVDTDGVFVDVVENDVFGVAERVLDAVNVLVLLAELVGVLVPLSERDAPLSDGLGETDPEKEPLPEADAESLSEAVTETERKLDFVAEGDEVVDRVFDATLEDDFDLILVGVRDCALVFVLYAVADDESEYEPVDEKLVESVKDSEGDCDTDGQFVSETETLLDID